MSRHAYESRRLSLRSIILRQSLDQLKFCDLTQPLTESTSSRLPLEGATCDVARFPYTDVNPISVGLMIGTKEVSGASGGLTAVGAHIL